MRRYGAFFNKPVQQGAVRYFGTEALFVNSEDNIYLYKFFHDQGLSGDPMESVSQHRARCLSEFKSHVKQHLGCYTVLAIPTYAGWKQKDPARAEKLTVDFMYRMRQAATKTHQTASFSGDHEVVPGHIAIFDADERNEYGYLSHKKLPDKNKWDAMQKDVITATGNQEVFVACVDKKYFTKSIDLVRQEANAVGYDVAAQYGLYSCVTAVGLMTNQDKAKDVMQRNPTVALRHILVFCLKKSELNLAEKRELEIAMYDHGLALTIQERSKRECEKRAEYQHKIQSIKP